jgi:hypothetical protein
MALIALTTGDLVKFVSDQDPAKTKTKVPNDPTDATKGEKEVESIDYQTATVFYVRPLDVFLMGAIYDGASELTGRQGQEEIGIHTKVNKTNIEAVKFGLSKWENFADANGKSVNVKTEKMTRNRREYEVVDDATINMLGIQLVQELANKIKSISEVSKVALKNSVPA